jgi:HSP20 family protein
MTLLAYKPYQQFDDIWSLLDHPLVQAQREKRESLSKLLTPADVIENDDSYLVYMDLPGFERDNIDISYHEGRLTIKGHRETRTEENADKFKSIERTSGSFCRNFSFPEIIDSENLSAKYTNGVLEVRAPKQPIIKPKRIDVK